MDKPQIRMVKTADVRPYWRNPRKHNNVDEIVKSIQEFGFTVPLVLDEGYTVITGHGRLKAAKILKLAEIPCIISDMGPDKAKQYRLADNQIASLSTYDFDALEKEIREIGDADILMAFGFDESMLNQYLEFGGMDQLPQGDATGDDPGDDEEQEDDEGDDEGSGNGESLDAMKKKLQEEYDRKEQKLLDEMRQRADANNKNVQYCICPECGHKFPVRGNVE